MEHIKEIELTEFVAGRLTVSRSEEIAKHLAECPECSKRSREADKLWNTLGQWNVDTAGHDITSRIFDSAKALQSDRKQDKQPNIIKGDFWVDILRVAASIIIAVALGQKIGKLSAGQTTPPSVQTQAMPKYIAALGLEWSSEFTWLIMDEQPPEQEQQ